jgi:hypothetical protein
MAKCSNCGVNVGCGCQLKNGLCSFCAQQQAQIKNINVTYSVVNPEDNVVI